MPEIFDLVDENNNVVGQTTKREAHAHGYPHRIVVVLVFNQNSELLINIRANNGLFDHSSAGHLRSGEDIDSAARREAFEEIGLPLEAPIKNVGAFFYRGNGRAKGYQHWVNLYEIKIPNFSPVIDPNEVKSVSWKSMENVEAEMRVRPELYEQGFISTMNYYISRSRPDFQPIPEL